jgi:ribonuclease HII
MLKGNYSKYKFEAGCDEAGRGCLAGPVFAAAVIIPKRVKIPGLNDSKTLSEKQRNRLRIQIETKTIWAVASCSPREIENINILNASILAMHRALDSLTQRPEFIIVDGNRFKFYPEIAHQTIVKGDSLYLSIAAASILAKTHRDQYMKELSVLHPEYEWSQNKGYPTKRHRELIKIHGCCVHHRSTFKLKEIQQKIF